METKHTRKALDNAISEHITKGEDSVGQVSVGQVSVGHAIDDSKPRDADEQALYHQYQLDLWKLRKQKAMGVFIKPAEIVVPTIKKNQTYQSNQWCVHQHQPQQLQSKKNQKYQSKQWQQT